MDNTESAATAPLPESPLPAPGLLQTVFGQWDPPPWCRWLYRRKWPVLGALAALAVIGYAVFWWVTRPPPVIPNALELSVSAPGLTDYDRDQI